jgi:hypothetical protein
MKKIVLVLIIGFLFLSIGIGETAPPIAKLYSSEATDEIWIDDAHLLVLESGSVTEPLNTLQIIKSYGWGESELRFDNGNDILAAIYTLSNNPSLGFLLGGVNLWNRVTFDNPNSSGDLEIRLRARSTNEAAVVFNNSVEPTETQYASKIYRPSDSDDLIVNFNGIGDVMTFNSFTGNVGIGTASPSQKLHVNGNVTADDYLYNSSREYKDNIETLSADEALLALKELRPVTFKYKSNREEHHVGFISEDVPELVATKNRKGLSPMDIVAVLTKVVQEQQKTIEKQQNEIKELKEDVKHVLSSKLMVAH